MGGGCTGGGSEWLDGGAGRVVQAVRLAKSNKLNSFIFPPKIVFLEFNKGRKMDNSQIVFILAMYKYFDEKYLLANRQTILDFLSAEIQREMGG